MSKNSTTSCTVFVLAAISFALAAQLQSEIGLVIEARVVGTKYCVERDSRTGLRLRLEVEYSNPGGVPILVPNVARVSSYTIFRDLEEYQRGQAEDRRVYRKPSANELPRLSISSSEPDPQLFAVLPPGGKIRRTMVASVFVGHQNDRHTVPLGTDRYVLVEIDHWPFSPGAAKTASEAWKRSGILLTWKIKISSPVKIHVDSNPQPEPCWMQID